MTLRRHKDPADHIILALAVPVTLFALIFGARWLGKR